MIIEVSGRVQGVGYRFSARQAAILHGLKGYVKNLPSGKVRLEIEGPPEAVRAMINWCREGPSMARVTAMQTWETEEKNDTTFRISY